MVRRRANPGDVEKLLLDTATQDGKRVRIGFGKDPGQAGKSQALHLVRALSGFTVGAGPGEWRQADTVWAVQFAMPRRQREDPSRGLERGAVPSPRRIPRSRP